MFKFKKNRIKDERSRQFTEVKLGFNGNKGNKTLSYIMIVSGQVLNSFKVYGL